uniref:Macrophage mannose receptor 1-like n=1 Tax=Podarcis muralis TaxID=64176 RepID=A0A670JH64_PODMU|nr:macrophage mannose receptor 1-like isoform X1 [Podarcis muralis]XP_028607053.1 macrophage mannose receptor 1-like isoform X1 [Podarcis muralis]
MSSLWLLNLLLLIQPAFQVSDSDSFLIYNENLKLCIQSQKSGSIIVDNCDEDNEWQHFKWVSDDQVLNMGVKLCLAVPSKSNLVALTLSPCNETSELQKWECRNESLLALEQGDLFLNPEGGQKSRLILSKVATSKSTWKIYGTKDSLCSKAYEALYTLEGNSFGAPCMFPFKYRNELYAQCIRDNDEHGRLWCGTTADVDRDSLTGYCPVKDDEFFWTKNHWTGNLYQINSRSALTWYQARKSCRQQNAELLSITSLHEQAYLTGLINSMTAAYWIGLISFDAESGWQWVGDRPFRYLNWAPGSPSPETEKLCGSMLSNNGNWENDKCHQKLGYICKKENSSLDVSFIPSDGLKPIKCPDGWAAFAGHCYCLKRDLKTWKNALWSCREEDGDLISIHSIEEYSFVISQLGYQSTDLLWIGLNDQKIPKYYEWSDGSTVRLTKWQKGKPAHINDEQSACVIMNGESGYWADYFCEEELGFICKREPLGFLPEEPENADPNCKKGWKRHGSYCYLISQTSATFSEANTFCETNKGSLASVENRYEQAFLTSLIGLRSEKYFWIGLSDVQQQGTFKWINRDNVLFTDWNSGMPGEQSGCVAMRTGTAAGLWDVVNCKEKAAFICKKWAETMTTTPAPSTIPPPPCPEGWLQSPYRSVCFKAYTSNMLTWFEARDFCRAIGGDLASANSEEKFGLYHQFRRNCWVGLIKLEPDKGFTWSDGFPQVDYEPYLYSSRHVRDEGCVAAYIRFMGLALSSCENVFCWICQIKRGAQLKPEPRSDIEYLFRRIEDGWIEYKGKEYYFSNEQTSLERAREFCKKHGGDLTVIESRSEWQFVWRYSKCYGSAYYIGLILGLDRKFSWLDGTPVTFAMWAPNEPNFSNDEETCVYMNRDSGLWYDINCGTKNRFICERHNSSVRSTPAPTTPAPVGGCADGWLFFDKKCFQFFGLNEEERKNWSDARTACRNLGGNLATIPNKATQAFFMVHLESASIDPWIGLNDIIREESFLWTDGSEVYYTNWASGFPSYGDCVFIIKRTGNSGGKWRDGPCSARKSYICQRNSDPALPYFETTIPASGYFHFGNSSYFFIGNKMTWEDARKKCNSEQSELASIWNPYIESFLWLKVLKYGEPVWIGLTSNTNGEQYTWINNRRLMYTNWAPEEPKHKIACVFMDLEGHWKTGTCNETYLFICEQHHGAFPTEAPQLPGKCPPPPEDDGRAWVPFRAHCYKFYPAWEPWWQTAFRCSYFGGTLASIEDLAELDFLLEYTRQFNKENFGLDCSKI